MPHSIEVRMAVLETIVANQGTQLAALNTLLGQMDEKLDDLTAVANQGKGGLRMLLIVGGGVAALASTIAWIIGYFKGANLG
jgi:hypothetical protein